MFRKVKRNAVAFCARRGEEDCLNLAETSYTYECLGFMY